MNQALRFDKAAITRISKTIDGRKSPRHIRFNCRQAFGGVDLCGKTVLEIGAGEGILSAYAATHGARYVVALEPEAAGSDDKYVSTIRRMKQQVGTANFEVVNKTIQAYDSGGRKFDIVLLWNSINHLDEPMCAELGRSAEARNVYRNVLKHLASIMSPGALLILGDCSRRNLYKTLRLKHPVTPQIEWHKHHCPGRWVDLLKPLGFTKRCLSWTTAYPLRLFAPLLNNAVAAYLTFSHFRLVLSYDGDNAE